MAEKEFNEILKIIRNYLLAGIIALFITVATSSIIFYFNTKSKNVEQDKRLERLEEQCAKKDLIDIKLNYISNSLQELKEDVKLIKNK